jgi:polar amino acid transport system permease protein
MTTQRDQRRRASSQDLFDLLSAVPWWGVIVAIVGIIVAYSVLTDVRYLDAISFLLDLPWTKEKVTEVPVEGESWTYTPDELAPILPGVYRLYAEFNETGAAARQAIALRAEPDARAEQTAELQEDERVRFVRWHIVPSQGTRLKQEWVYVSAEDGRTGWALGRSFVRKVYESVGESGTVVLAVSEGAGPGVTGRITVPVGAPTTDREGAEAPIQVSSTTPTLGGPVLGGSWVVVYKKFNFRQTVSRVWNSRGLLLTIRATFAGYGLALVLGLLTGLMLVSRNPITLSLSKLYVEVVRGIPLLVIILYAGFVITPYLRDATGGKVDLSGFPGAIIGLGFGYGAYLAEVFRAGIQSIHRGQMEAARSLGMSYFQAMRYVVLPQAIRVVLPPLGNDFIAMLKDSSLISVVALPEVLQQGRLWVSRTFRAFEGYNTVALFYLVMTLILSLLVRFIERKTALPGRVED